ncbi:sensor domain-containing diguanylate cyclase [Billgrantia azerbaijanica]|nr:sensor domain-containing diguanylate cyclase [Halomonas azerbaijanica]
MDSLGMDLEASDYRAALKRDTRAIQPCGCLVTVDRQWRRIRMASINLGCFFDLTSDEALDHSPHRLLGAPLVDALQQALSHNTQAEPSRFASHRLRSAERSLLVTAHGTTSGATLEIEPLDGLRDDLTCRAMAWGSRIAECADEEQTAELWLRAIRELSGHDQASIHHFAPTACPTSASLAPLRMVADTQANPIPLIGEPLASEALSSSDLLALPAEPARQLRQRTIRSVLAIPLQHGSEPPWGTLIGYSNVPRYLSPPLRRLLQLITQTAWQRLQLLDARRNLQRRQRFLDTYGRIDIGSQQRLPIRTLREASQTWLDDFRACGMLLVHGDQVNGIGMHPDTSTLAQITHFLEGHSRSLPWANHDLSQTPLAGILVQNCPIAGLLATPLSTGGKADGWLLLFRQAHRNGVGRPWSTSDLHSAQDLACMLSADIAVCNARQVAHQLQKHNATLMRLAHTDPVTQIANRHRIEQVLDDELLDCEHSHRPCSLLLFDIDHFKRINDTHGHDAGDKVLRQLAQETLTRLRAGDHLGRWGGEEFLIIAPDCPLQAATELANRLCRERQSTPIPPAGSISISIGVTCWQPGDTPKSIVRRADLAMYEAKEAGRGCVRVVETPP